MASPVALDLSAALSPEPSPSALADAPALHPPCLLANTALHMAFFYIQL